MVLDYVADSRRGTEPETESCRTRLGTDRRTYTINLAVRRRGRGEGRDRVAEIDANVVVSTGVVRHIGARRVTERVFLDHAELVGRGVTGALCIASLPLCVWLVPPTTQDEPVEPASAVTYASGIT